MIPCVISDALAFVCSSPYTAHHFTAEDDVGMRTRVEPMFGHAPFVLFLLLTAAACAARHPIVR
jgi:hypothetical protein